MSMSTDSTGLLTLRGPARPVSRRPAARQVRSLRRGTSTVPAAALPAPYWRDLLDDHWRAALMRLTKLSLAFHEAAECIGIEGGRRAADGRAADGGEFTVPGGCGARRAARQLRRLERQAVVARRALADIEDALGRLSAGRYGRCEQCAADIPARWLLNTPQERYCPRCSPATAPATRILRTSQARKLLAPVLLFRARRVHRAG
jgi:hypothetical protein